MHVSEWFMSLSCRFIELWPLLKHSNPVVSCTMAQCFSTQHLCVLKRVVDHSWRVAHCTVGRMPHCRLPHSNTPTEHWEGMHLPSIHINLSTLFSLVGVNALSVSSPFSTLSYPCVAPEDVIPTSYSTCHIIPCNCLISSNRLARI